ncbi:MAG: biopolymer transporter ExbD [Salinisphaera sp.]|jgi:biopolymer transport protein ExbD|nr:biopolymer transporter ExbD [Salinisphaera sp.]
MAIGAKSSDDEVLCEINVTPLVDVMLVLLVVFIVTASAVTTAVKINLPKTDAVVPPDTHKPLVVSVDQDGRYYIGKEPVTITDMKTQLVAAHQKNPNIAAQLQADAGVKYGRVAKAMVALQEAGIQKIAVLSNPGGN